MAKRDLTITIKRVSGTLTRVLAWANGYPIIVTDGGDGKWKGKIPSGKVKLETAVWGQGKAKYAVVIDLPGTANDQELQLSLSNGYHDGEDTF
jgi:hypothetical protein